MCPSSLILLPISQSLEHPTIYTTHHLPTPWTIFLNINRIIQSIQFPTSLSFITHHACIYIRSNSQFNRLLPFSPDLPCSGVGLVPSHFPSSLDFFHHSILGWMIISCSALLSTTLFCSSPYPSLRPICGLGSMASRRLPQKVASADDNTSATSE